MCVSWRQSRRCTLMLSCRWGTAKIFGEQCSQKKGRWENAFCKEHANMMALLGLSDFYSWAFLLGLSLQNNFAGSKWLLVACHYWSSRGDFQNLPNSWGLSWGGRMGGSQEGEMSISGVASPWFLGKKRPLFFFLFPKVWLLKGVLNRVLKTLRQYG